MMDVMENVPAARGVVEKVVDDDGRNRHGFPRGYNFYPWPIELISVLDQKLAGRPLPYPPNIFHDVKILDYHPADLYEAHKAHQEAGFIYFFSYRVFPVPRGARVHPVRATKYGGWRASGSGKPVTRGGVNVGYEHTFSFYQKKTSPDDESSGVTEWGMHEYTKIIGPSKKVADLALYRLYNKNRKADQHVAAVSNGSSKLEELPSPRPAQAEAQASVGQAYDCYQHQYAFGALESAPGPSSWVTLAAADPPGQLPAGCTGLTGSPPAPLLAPSLQVTTGNCSPTSPQQQVLSQEAIDHYALAGWDNMLLLPPPPAAFVQPTSQQQNAEYPVPADSNELLKMLQPPTMPAQASQGYLDDEFNIKVWCEMQQKKPGDDDLPMLTHEENQLHSCTLEELLMRDEEPDKNDLVQSNNR